jgi:hypothetical protein
MDMVVNTNLENYLSSNSHFLKDSCLCSVPFHNCECDRSVNKVTVCDLDNQGSNISMSCIFVLITAFTQAMRFIYLAVQ